MELHLPFAVVESQSIGITAHLQILASCTIIATAKFCIKQMQANTLQAILCSRQMFVLFDYMSVSVHPAG